MRQERAQLSSPSTTAAAVIPARMGARRLPGKPLQLLGGLPLLEHVRRRVLLCRLVDRVVVATPDPVIVDTMRDYGAEVILTGPAPSGTHRVALVADDLDVDHVVNVQGDQPLLRPEAVDTVIRRLRAGAAIATLSHGGCTAEDAKNPAKVKVVVDQSGQALYFSRAPIPVSGPWRIHVGVYGFQRQVLRALAELPPSELAISEDLEQLSWLQAGHSIHVDATTAPAGAVDTPEQLEDLRALLEPALKH